MKKILRSTKLLYLLSLLLFVGSCIKSPEGKDSTSNQVIVARDQSGKIKTIEIYSPSVVKQINFFQNGSIKSIMYFKNNILNGSVYEYFPNGVLRYKHELIVDSIANGSSWEFFNTGQIHKYRFYNSKGDLTYLRIYNKLGNIIMEKGDVLGELSIKDTTIQGQTKINLHTRIIDPPYCITKLAIYLLEDRGKKRTNILTTTAKDTTIFIDFGVFPGEFEISAELIDTITMKTQNNISKISISRHNSKLHK